MLKGLRLGFDDLTFYLLNITMDIYGAFKRAVVSCRAVACRDSY